LAGPARLKQSPPESSSRRRLREKRAEDRIPERFEEYCEDPASEKPIGSFSSTQKTMEFIYTRYPNLQSVRFLREIAEVTPACPGLLQDDGEALHLHMNFGLHAGWAIEGAVGSPHKVDATYLSPHVNMAARMETACNQYKLPLLMTENFYEVRHPRLP
jgi:hypothetical protein